VKRKTSLLFRLPWLVFSVVLFALIIPPVSADDVVPSDRVKIDVSIRQRPERNSPRLGALRPGERAEYLGSVPRWHKVRLSNGKTGFVSKGWTRIVPTGDSGEYTIDVVDVGTGLAILVRGKDFTLIYDGGSNDDRKLGDNNRFIAYLRAVAPNLKTIDHVILSHPHQDHVELLADVFKNYQVRHVWDSGRIHPICGYRAFMLAVKGEPGVTYHSATHGFTVEDIKIGKMYCSPKHRPEITIKLSHGSRISNSPIPLGQGASMTFLYSEVHNKKSPNESSLVVRLDLGKKRILLMGDAEAGGRKPPSTPPKSKSIEGLLLTCCAEDLRADVLVVGHHGSLTSSRSTFLDAVGAQKFIVSSGPIKYGSVVLPDKEVITELKSRGEVFRTDLNDDKCGQSPAKIGNDKDGKPGGCDNIRVLIKGDKKPEVGYWRGSD
jgi:beta-lactamase superfamily II metal-dependent hydrolase